MGNGNQWERAFKLWATAGKLVLNGSRSIKDMVDMLQDFVTNPDRRVIGSAEPFELMADLGVLTTPQDYDHRRRLELARSWPGDGLAGPLSGFVWNDDLTDDNFPWPQHTFVGGRRVRVQVFRHAGPGNVSYEEAFGFLQSKRAIYPGPQGLTLLYEQMRDQLTGLLPGEAIALVGLDYPHQWYEDHEGRVRIPVIDRSHVSGKDRFRLDLAFYENDLRKNDLLVCYTWADA